MPSFYTVAQYVPDPDADERINFGVLTFGDGTIHARFLHDWRRVRSFGGEDVGFLREFAARVLRDARSQARLPLSDGDAQLTEARLSAMIGGWANAIQFTRPRASTLPAAQLIDRIAPQFLREPARREQDYRTRTTAANFAFEAITKGLRAQVGNEAARYIQRSLPIYGDSDEHQYDVGLRNGHIYAAVRAISFETGEPSDIDQEVRVVAWDLTDVRKQFPAMQLAVVAIPPQGDSRHWDRLKHISDKAGAELLTDASLPAWTEQVTAKFAREVVFADHHLTDTLVRALPELVVDDDDPPLALPPPKSDPQ